jgi:hypothetical protein
MHLFGGLNMGMGMDWYGEQARQIRNASVHRDINFVHDLKDRLGAADHGKERDREVHKLVEMMQARDRKEEIAKAKAEGSKEAEERLRGQDSGFAIGGGTGMIGGGGMGGGGGGVMGGGNGGMGYVTPAGVFPFNTLNPLCPVHGHIYGRPCYHCQALGRGGIGYIGP